jgi:hypothetical protein
MWSLLEATGRRCLETAARWWLRDKAGRQRPRTVPGRASSQARRLAVGCAPGMDGNRTTATRKQSRAETRRGQPRSAYGRAGSQAPCVCAGVKRSGARHAEVDFVFLGEWCIRQ